MKVMSKATLGLMIIVFLFLTSCSSIVTSELQIDLGETINTVTPETASGNSENTVIEDTEDPEMIYPQKWATGDGTAEYPWANDCIQKAYDACPTGGTIFLRAGYYQLAGIFNITKQINIIGEGIDNTIIKTADTYGLHISEVDYVTIKGLTVDGIAQTRTPIVASSSGHLGAEVYRYCIGIGGSNYISLEDIEAKNGSGFGIDANNDNHLSFHNIYAHDNGDHGIHPGNSILGRNTCNTYRDIYCWNNRLEGFGDATDVIDPNEIGNTYDNLQCWDNGMHGIVIVGHNGVLSNSSASGNGKNEIYSVKANGIYLAGCENFNVNDCYADLTAGEGLEIINSKNVNLTNVIIKNNNVSDTDGIGGIFIENSSNINFISCQSYDDRNTPLQFYGMMVTWDSADISLLNCILMPNEIAAIYNPSGVVIVEKAVNAEAMLPRL